jgi:hypothetical protein
MEFKLVGNLVTLSAWREGTPRPQTPMLMRDLTTISDFPLLPSQGRIGLYTVAFDQVSVSRTTEFRFFQAFPEPSTILLAALVGLLAPARVGRRIR